MDPIFGHPIWISSGVLLLAVGFLLFRWSRQTDVSKEITDATREAAVNKLLKGGQTTPAASKKIAANNFKRSMAQLFGIVGFLLILAGLMAVLLGIFYPGE